MCSMAIRQPTSTSTLGMNSATRPSSTNISNQKASDMLASITNGNIIFPQLPAAPDLPNPPDGTDNAGPNNTNQIFAAPCEFISPHLPLCSVIRPISTQQAGAKATVAFFKDDGLFIGQSQDF